MKHSAHDTMCICPLFLDTSPIDYYRLVHAIIHFLPSIHFSRRLHRNVRTRNKKGESIGQLRQKPPLPIERHKYQNWWETQRVFFSWRWLEAKSRSFWTHHQLWENPNLTSILSIYPFAFPTQLQTILTACLAASGLLAIGIRQHRWICIHRKRWSRREQQGHASLFLSQYCSNEL